MLAPLIELKDISKAFAGIHALSSVNFTLNPGEVHALVGENGAGKSTLMRVLGGEIQPDEGTITIAGEPAHSAVTRSCARRILLLATSCTARVICATFRTERIRRRISCVDGMFFSCAWS